MNRGRTITTYHKLALVFSTLGLLILVGSHTTQGTAWAAPCCYECPGWPDEPPPYPDRCWDNCVFCAAADTVSLDESSACASPDQIQNHDTATNPLATSDSDTSLMCTSEGAETENPLSDSAMTWTALTDYQEHKLAY